MLDATTSHQPSPVPGPVEAAGDPVLTPCECKKPSMQTMDYKKHSPDAWNHPEPRINRVCLKCWAHWFGPPEAVRFYTSKEWDVYISESE